MLPTAEAQVETPMGVLADVEYVDPAQPVAIVPVLRAGLAMAESAQTIVPASVTYHVGYVRDDETLEAAPYLNKLPDSFDMDSKVVVMDIMLATGMTHVYHLAWALCLRNLRRPDCFFCVDGSRPCGHASTPFSSGYFREACAAAQALLRRKYVSAVQLIAQSNCPIF